MSQSPLSYETPRPRPPGDATGCLPYIVFAACAAIAGFGLFLQQVGSESERALGVLIGVPAALGAIVLPLVIVLQTRLRK